jgi:predicted dehydrogenase
MQVAHVYRGLDEMLAGEPDLGLLVVSTPDDHHPAAIRRAAAAGVAVYCEKPLAASATGAADLDQAVAAAGIPATIGFSFRYATAVQQLRSDLRAGLLGTPWLLELYERNPQFHPVAGRPLTWKGDPRQAGGGALFEYGAHVVDLGSWLLGPVADVTASFATVIPGAALDDIAALQLRYESGALGTLMTSWVLAGGFPGIRVRLHGSAGVAEAILGAATEDGERYVRRAPSGEVVTDLDLTVGTPGKGACACRHLRDFVALASGAPLDYPDTLPTIRDALHVQYVLDTALRATAVRLPVPEL